MPNAVTFLSYDESVSLTREVRDAFDQEGLAITAPPGAQSYGVAAAPTKPAKPPPVYEMPMATVRKHLLTTEAGAWRLAVRFGDNVEVLDRRDLEEAINKGGAANPLIVRLRSPTEQELRVLDASKAYFSPDSSLKRIEESINAPVALISAVGTFAGLCGLLAAKDEIQREWAVGVSIGAMILAIALALFGRYDLRVTTLKLSRLDLLEQAFNQLQRRPGVRLSRAGLLLLVVGLAFATLAVYPDKTHSAAATISVPSAKKTGGSAEVHVKVSWTHLPETASGVRVIVRQGALNVTHRIDKSGSDATLEFDEDLPRDEPFTVTTEAVNAKGDGLGAGFMRTFTAP